MEGEPGQPGGTHSQAEPAAPPISPKEKRKAFRERVGIKEDGAPPPRVRDALNRHLHRQDLNHRLQGTPANCGQGAVPDRQLHQRLERAYTRQTQYYFFMAGLTNGMLWLQIAIGATLTALGSNSNRSARVAVTVLGALNTFIAGLLTFLKSRNQPNRAQQFRNGLRGVYEDLWRVDAEMLSQKPETEGDVDRKVNDLWKRYKDVRAEAEANYPDLWVSVGKLMRTRIPGKDNHPSENGSGT